jgi:hypothetical protein
VVPEPLIFLLLIFVIYKICMMFFQEVEGFLPSGEYPVAVDKPILYDSYNISDHPGADALGAAQIYVDYPIFPAHSVKINNIRYWNIPTNGECQAPDMCNGLYKPTPQKEFVPSVSPQWNNERRVNYQVSKNDVDLINK